MISFYIGAFGFGALFILTSIIFGGSDSDFDKDIEIDLDGDVDIELDGDVDIELHGDHDVHLDAEAWLPFLSLRFWTFAFFSLGMSGTILTLLNGDSNKTVTFVISLFLGLTLGYGISWIFQKLKKDSVTASTDAKSFELQEGMVQLAIRPHSQGKIRLKIDNQIVDLRAITQDKTEIPMGSKVIIVSVENGVANVTKLSRPSTNLFQEIEDKESQS